MTEKEVSSYEVDAVGCVGACVREPEVLPIMDTDSCELGNKEAELEGGFSSSERDELDSTCKLESSFSGLVGRLDLELLHVILGE